VDAEYKRAYWLYHLCVFLWGFTAVFGRIIALNETVLVWYRMGITSLILLFLPRMLSRLRSVSKKVFFQLVGIGILVTIHWIAFYGSIKASNISVALTCLATTSFFVAILEPLFFGRKFIWHELFLAILVVPAMYLVFRFSGDYRNGIILGLISTLFATLFSLFNKKMISKTAPLTITFLEIATGFLVLSACMPVYFIYFPDADMVPDVKDSVYLVLFSAFCTVLPFALSLYCMKHISVFTASITLNLEPVYGIAMAILLFRENENLDPGFYFGTLLILAVVFINPYIQRRFGDKIKPPVPVGE